MLIGAGLVSQEKEAELTYQAARQEYEESKRVVSSDAAPESPHARAKAYRDEWRAERDLEAQRIMAKWSFWTALAAMFGVFLLAATLWETTRTTVAATEAADAARLSADAQVSAERAHLFLVLDEYYLKAIQERIVGASCHPADMDDATFDTTLSVSYHFANYGKSPAVIKEISHELAHLEALPAIPSYVPINDRLLDRTVRPGGSTEVRYCGQAHVLRVSEAKSIASGQSALWFIGRVIYSDIFGRDHVHAFLWQYSGNGFRPDYREAYNKNV